jgi:hypothetical protein
MKAKRIKQEVTLGNYIEFQRTEQNFKLLRDRLHSVTMRGLKRSKAK